MTAAREYEYDVAISFVGADGGIATQLKGLLPPALRERTFISPEEQRQLVAADGVERFGEVFGRTARIVVVLYRQTWGKTQWTRIEQEAIHGRALTAKEGWDFLLMVSLDGDVPEFYPANRIWAAWDRLGLNGLAGVIEQMALERGSRVRQETAVEMAARQAREATEETDRLVRFRKEGHEVARREVDAVFDTLEGLVGDIRASDPQRSLQTGRGVGRDQIVVRGVGVSASVYWQGGVFRPPLQNAALLVTQFDGLTQAPGERLDPGPAVVTGRRRLLLDLTLSGVWCWRDEQSSESFTSARLADLVLRELLERKPKERRRN